MKDRYALLVPVAVVAAVVCFLAYLPALSCGFINWDDPDYLLNNEVFRTLDLEMLVRAFTTIPLNYWIPLTWISYAVDYHFWGMNPTGYHLTNNLLHAGNTALLVCIADRLYRWRPEFLAGFLEDGSNAACCRLRYGALLFLAALLWGLHPARVESVVWATERKDVLSGMFQLATILTYLQYARLRQAGADVRGCRRPYLLALLFFICSLMAKPSGVVLPLLLLLLDWYPLGRFDRAASVRLLLEKIPYLLFAGSVAGITVLVGAVQGAFIPTSEFSYPSRVAVIGNALFEYVKLLLNPAGIITYYHLPFSIPAIYVYKAAAAFVVIAGCFFLGRRQAWFIATLLAFLIPLLPVLQFFPNGLQPALCTRYTYLPTLLPSLVLPLLIANGYRRLTGCLPGRGAAIAATLVTLLLVYYGVVTQRLIGDWKNSATFWSKVIATEPFERAYFYRGLYYVDNGDYQAAAADYTAALGIMTAAQSQETYNIYAFRGEALARGGRYAEAVQDFDAAIAMFPHRLYYYHRGAALQALGRTAEAAADFARAGRARGQMHWFPPGSALQ